MSNIANVQIAADATVKVGKKSFTLDAAIKHATAVYDNMWLLQEQMLDNYREIGLILLGIKALFGDNDKAFGQYVAKTELSAMSRQDRTDAMFLAANWTKVQTLNKNGALETLGVSAIRKRLKDAEGKASGAAKRAEEKPEPKNSPKGKAEAVAKEEPKAPKIKTEADLAEFVWQVIAEGNLNFAVFAKALNAHRTGK
jgi:hypothetical protein